MPGWVMDTALRMALGSTILVGVLLSAVGAAAVDSVAGPTGESARIDAWVQGRLADRGLPGAAVAVVRGGRVVHLAGYGSADGAGRRVTPDTPFILGSVSKPFTAVVIGQLVREGLLSWDEPVWPHLSDLVDEAPDGFASVTVEQLLTHTGGLGMWVGVAGEVKIRHGPDALDRRVGELLAHPLAGAPCDAFAYSNAGPMLLAAVAEQGTGRSFAEQLRARVFEPLGMSGSFATADDPRAPGLATGHRLWFGRWRPAELPYDDAGVAMGYVASTARDLVRFMQAHLDGHPAIPATAGEIAAGPVVSTGWTTTLDAGYGRGWFVDELAGTTVVSHPGSLGHFTAHVLLAPDADGLGVAVVSNASAFLAGGVGDRGHDAQYDLGFGLVRMLLGEQHQPVDPTVLMTVVVPVAAWGAVALLFGTILRSLIRLRRQGLASTAGAKAGRWARSLLPGAAHLAVGAGLLATPLGLARHFYPDAGWAVTGGAWLTLTWGAVRLVLGIVSVLRGDRTSRAAHPFG
jgi:CubicO group peptidase (beta-lactamase class C family)